MSKLGHPNSDPAMDNGSPIIRRIEKTLWAMRILLSAKKFDCC